MSEDHDDGSDLEWVPPSAAEQKVITARRERSDKISKLMGNYLLRGKILTLKSLISMEFFLFLVRKISQLHALHI